jgi:hypothetical protein
MIVENFRTPIIVISSIVIDIGEEMAMHYMLKVHFYLQPVFSCLFFHTSEFPSFLH